MRQILGVLALLASCPALAAVMGDAAAVPEPGSFVVLGAGLIGLGILIRRRYN